MLSTLDSLMVPDHTSPVVYVGNLLLVPTRMKHAPTLERSLDDQKFRPSGYIATLACWAHNTSMQSVSSILAHRGQPMGP
jgi:hypothetical protein